METLRRHCLLSSTVTLGCASEQAMLLLIERTAAALEPAAALKLKKLTLVTMCARADRLSYASSTALLRAAFCIVALLFLPL